MNAIFDGKMKMDYELVDCGEGRRLERFAGILVDRPAPQAFWPRQERLADWQNPRLIYERDGSRAGWSNVNLLSGLWRLPIDSYTLELKTSENGQIGVFPEQLPNWSWLKHLLQRTQRPVQVLNVFAYTGSATLAAASAGTHVNVCHVDAAKSAVNWAKRNAELSGAMGKNVRWIVEDAITFLNREIKRGHRYDAVILDPPAFGRADGKSWQLRRDLPNLMRLVNELLSDNPVCVILSCHAPELSVQDLKSYLAGLHAFRGCFPEVLDLQIASQKGNALPAGFCARISRSF